MKREIMSSLFLIFLAGMVCAQTQQTGRAAQAPDPGDPGA